MKEASGNISQIVSLFHKAEAHLDVYSGNDDQIVPILAMGGEGCISVLSNVLPKGRRFGWRAVLLRRCARRCGAPVPSAARHRRACFPRSIPFRSRRRWQKWATAPTRCVCRSRRWRKRRRAVLLNALEVWVFEMTNILLHGAKNGAMGEALRALLDAGFAGCTAGPMVSRSGNGALHVLSEKFWSLPTSCSTFPFHTATESALGFALEHGPPS